MTLNRSSNLGSDATEDQRYYLWTEALACGHEDIDTDHQYLFDIAERFRNASLQVQDNVVIGDILNELLDYIQEHFAREEALMIAINYPEIEDHRFEHNLLRRHVWMLYQDLLDEKPIAYADMWQFLRRWLRYHIMRSDRQVAQHAATVRLRNTEKEYNV